MNSNLQNLQNEHWDVGILPGTGTSIAFGRVRHGDQWIDVMRPTAESDYGRSSNCSSFLMLPWCNRIKDGLLRFGGKEYQLRTTKDDGTARHGDTRDRAWQVDELDRMHIHMSFQSEMFSDVNWPFKFSAWAEYRLEGADFVWTYALKNKDNQPMPGGFGPHPYFVRTDDVQVQIPCEQYFQLTNLMATDAPVAIAPAVDYRKMHGLPASELNHLLTARQGDEPARIHYPQNGVEVDMYAEALYTHILIYAPVGKPFFAVEPMTNASDGFNLYQRGIPGSGVFVLEPGEEKSAMVRLRSMG